MGTWADEQAAYLEDSHGNTDAVLACGGPIKLLHAPISDEGGIQGGEIITSAHHWHTGDFFLLHIQHKTLNLEISDTMLLLEVKVKGLLFLQEVCHFQLSA